MKKIELDLLETNNSIEFTIKEFVCLTNEQLVLDSKTVKVVSNSKRQVINKLSEKRRSKIIMFLKLIINGEDRSTETLFVHKDKIEKLTLIEENNEDIFKYELVINQTLHTVVSNDRLKNI